MARFIHIFQYTRMIGSACSQGQYTFFLFRIITLAFSKVGAPHNNRKYRTRHFISSSGPLSAATWWNVLIARQGAQSTLSDSLQKIFSFWLLRQQNLWIHFDYILRKDVFQIPASSDDIKNMSLKVRTMWYTLVETNIIGAGKSGLFAPAPVPLTSAIANSLWDGVDHVVIHWNFRGIRVQTWRWMWSPAHGNQ